MKDKKASILLQNIDYEKLIKIAKFCDDENIEYKFNNKKDCEILDKEIKKENLQPICLMDIIKGPYRDYKEEHDDEEILNLIDKCKYKNND